MGFEMKCHAAIEGEKKIKERSVGSIQLNVQEQKVGNLNV